MMTIMKKIYNQPTFQVVCLNNHDIVTLSRNDDPTDERGSAPGMRGLFDPDDSWANAGY